MSLAKVLGVSLILMGIMVAAATHTWQKDFKRAQSRIEFETLSTMAGLERHSPHLVESVYPFVRRRKPANSWSADIEPELAPGAVRPLRGEVLPSVSSSPMTSHK